MNSDLRAMSSKDRYLGYCLVPTDTLEGLIKDLEGFYSWRLCGERRDSDGIAVSNEKRMR